MNFGCVGKNWSIEFWLRMWVMGWELGMVFWICLCWGLIGTCVGDMVSVGDVCVEGVRAHCPYYLHVHVVGIGNGYER